jgi:hypothetical protein
MALRFTKLLALALVAATAGIAAAQPNPTPMQPSGGPDSPPDNPPPPQPPPPQPPPPHPMAAPEPAMHHDTGDRPEELAFAIGLGYVFPTSLETPNITSVRLRLPSGLTFEPRVIFASTSHSVDDGVTTTTDKTTEFSIGTLVRIPAIKRGRVDFEVLASADIDSITDNPDGDNNNTTTTTLTVAWGVACNFWLSRHWTFSLSATNPLIQYTKKKVDNPAMPGQTTATTDSSFGLIFDPVVFGMFHLYN